MEHSYKSFAIASLTCGILGIVLGWVPYINAPTIILSALGIIFGAISRKQKPNQMAIAGIICGIVGLVISTLGFLCVTCAVCGGSCLLLMGS